MSQPERPDPAAARRQLEDVKKRRIDVQQLVAALQRERQLNGFTASVTVVLRGGRE